MQYNPKVLVNNFQYRVAKNIPIIYFHGLKFGQKLCTDTLHNQSKHANEWNNVRELHMKLLQ